jgi:hypothetical protein
LGGKLFAYGSTTSGVTLFNLMNDPSALKGGIKLKAKSKKKK